MAETRLIRPTARRRRRARALGLVARSGLLSSAVLLAVAAIALAVSAKAAAAVLGALMAEALAEGHSVPAEDLGTTLGEWLAVGFGPVMPVLVALFATAVLVTLAQVGPVLSRRGIRADPSRLGPADGLRRLLTPERVVRGVTHGVGAAAIIVVTVVFVRSGLAVWARLPAVAIDSGLAVVGRGLAHWSAWTLGVLAVIGGLDLLVARLLRERRLMMTRAEAERERREAEGDPWTRAERRRLHRALSAFDYEQAVGASTLMIVAPGESAAGLYYDLSTSDAPELLAKGRGRVAASLLEMALRLGVPVVSDAELAGRLQCLAVGDRVAEDLFAPVARAIRRVMRPKEKGDA